jgi:hypothetical protein
VVERMREIDDTVEAGVFGDVAGEIPGIPGIASSWVPRSCKTLGTKAMDGGPGSARAGGVKFPARSICSSAQA